MGAEAKCPVCKLRIEIIQEEHGSEGYQWTQSNTIIIQDDQSPPPTAPIQSQSNQTNDEQDGEPTTPNKVQGLITELSTPTKGESEEADENEIPDGSLSQSLARLYQKAIKAEKRVTCAYQEEICVGITMRKGLKNGLKKLWMVTIESVIDRQGLRYIVKWQSIFQT